MGMLNLASMAIASLFKKPETIQYPTERKVAPALLKGHIHNDVASCILCGICEKRCPCSAIKVDKAARTWSINGYFCVQCGYCTQQCPKDCLHMHPEYTAASASIQESNIYFVPVIEK